jgi:hypothetical protein
MSHHSSEEMPDAFRRELLKELGAQVAPDALKIGATGEFPRGKLVEEDEGEIRVAIAADHKTQTVVIDFGKPVAWIGFTGEQAQQIADTLIKKAWELRGIGGS